MSYLKCQSEVTGEFISINMGGLLIDKNNPDHANWSDTIKQFFSIDSHSDINKKYESIDMERDLPYKTKGQSEASFCSKKCLIDWFISKVDVLSDPSKGA